MNKQEYIDTAEQELLHTYNRFSLVLDHGEGVYLYDTDKKAYLDFAAGIAFIHLILQRIFIRLIAIAQRTYGDSGCEIQIRFFVCIGLW